jgi:hypothetical protein
MSFTFDRHRIDIECPRCRFPARPFLRQVRLGDVIVCGGCKADIRLVDHMAAYRQADRRIRAAVDDLMSAMKNFGR